MNCLVVYYSCKGLTREVGESVSDLLQCDREEIREKKTRTGLKGFLSCCIDGLQKKRTEIEETAKDPADYDLVVIGTPVWWMRLSPPVRSYLFRHRGRFKDVAFYVTQGFIGSDNACREMERITGKKPVETMEIDRRDRKDGEGIAKVKEFVEELRR